MLGVLTSLSTEGVFLHHRYITYPKHENQAQKFASLAGMAIAIIGSLLFIGADLWLLAGSLDVESFTPLAIGGMVLVMLSAVLSETVYELSSHVARYERQKRTDALSVLKISDSTRLELDRADLEVMKAYSDLALASTFQKAENIRAAIPAAVEREAGAVDMLDTDDIREQLGERRVNPTLNNNGRERERIS